MADQKKNNGWGGIIVILIIVVLILQKCGESKQDNNKAAIDSSVKRSEETPIDGIYKATTDGVNIQLIIVGNAWYGESRMQETDQIINSSNGSVDGNKLIDEYGVEAGSVGKGIARVNINGYEVRLTK